MAQQDEFEAKAEKLITDAINRHWGGYQDGLHEPTAAALRAEHTRGDAAGYIRGQIEALAWLPNGVMTHPLREWVAGRIAELRKEGDT